MKIHRFFIEEITVMKKGITVIKDPEIVHQIRDVLRLQKGEQIILCDGKMNEAIAEITSMGKNAIDISILEVRKNANESQAYGILYCAILKKENFELVVQKAVEVGIKEIVPLITERTVKLNLKEERLKKIIKEAAEQSGRGVLPILSESMAFEKAISQAKGNNTNLFFDPTGKIPNDKFQIPNKSQNPNSKGIFIGPEGGWSEKEIEQAREQKFEIVSLGSLTLRAETAAIVGSWLALH
jgi:16S rRNA (uracil1498-N3)-methyltransferase